MSPVLVIGFAIVVLFFLSGSPIFVGMGLGGTIIACLAYGFPLDNIAQIAWSSVASYPLLACPTFILSGYLLVSGGAMGPLCNFIASLVGHIRGGIAVVTVLVATIFGALSGSSSATLAVIGTLLVPLMVDYGYGRNFAGGLAVSAGELGLIIPPSLFFIILGAITQTSIARLFAGGIIPGLIAAGFMAVFAVIICSRRKYPLVERANWKTRYSAFIKAIPALLMPVIVLGGIYGGVFSPTEAGIVASFYSLFIGTVVYRKLKWPQIKSSLTDSVKLVSMIYFLFICGDVLGKVLALAEVPQAITQVVVSFHLTPIVFLLVTEVALLIMGCFISSPPMVIVVLPLFYPTVYALGIDPYVFGVIGILAVLIGEVTPPVGPQLYIAVPICKAPMMPMAKEAIPFLVALALSMLLVTFFPPLATWMIGMMVG